MKRVYLFVIVIISILLAACGGSAEQTPVDEVTGQEVQVSKGTYTDISVAELQSMLEEKDFVFVNVHIPFEGDIPKTDLSIPFDEIGSNLDQLPADGFTFCCFPVKIKGASAGWIRPVAIIAD